MWCPQQAVDDRVEPGHDRAGASDGSLRAVRPAAPQSKAERAGLPDGVLNIITADPPDVVGDTFSSDARVRKISFTGSVKTGKNLMRIAARTLTKIGLELGGNNAFIVFEDADLDAAVEAAVVAKLRNGGQTCVCANRYLVHETVLEEFTARFANVLGKKAVGSGFEPTTTTRSRPSDQPARCRPDSKRRQRSRRGGCHGGLRRTGGNGRWLPRGTLLSSDRCYGE